MSGTNVTCTGTVFVDYPVKLCQKLFSNHNIFVQHYIACVKARNPDLSIFLLFDEPQSCCVCGNLFRKLLNSEYSNVCAA